MKYLLILFLFLINMGCGNQSEKETAPGTTDKTEAKDPKVEQGLALVAKSDCFSCHKLTENSIGPSYAAIALKYKTPTAENIDSMVSRIISGGAGRWGNIPMTPHPGVSKEDASLMSHYILSIKP